MKNIILLKANNRGLTIFDWLESYHSFSFANYYNPDRMNFGLLTLFNDDTVAEKKGFGMHPHKDAEIVTIPLYGELKHEDSMGNGGIMKTGDIQVMSAGAGIEHSEFNPNDDKITKFLQIWVSPRENGLTPRYQLLTLNPEDRVNTLQQILSPTPEDEGVWIHQDAWFHLGKFEKNKEANYTLKKQGNGIYAFVLSGDFNINSNDVTTRDSLEITNTQELNITSLSNDSEILLVEVPMNND